MARGTGSQEHRIQSYDQCLRLANSWTPLTGHDKHVFASTSIPSKFFHLRSNANILGSGTMTALLQAKAYDFPVKDLHLVRCATANDRWVIRLVSIGQGHVDILETGAEARSQEDALTGFQKTIEHQLWIALGTGRKLDGKNVTGNGGERRDDWPRVICFRCGSMEHTIKVCGMGKMRNGDTDYILSTARLI
jgi:hypothetical protein